MEGSPNRNVWPPGLGSCKCMQNTIDQWRYLPVTAVSDVALCARVYSRSWSSTTTCGKSRRRRRQRGLIGNTDDRHCAVRHRRQRRHLANQVCTVYEAVLNSNTAGHTCIMYNAIEQGGFNTSTWGAVGGSNGVHRKIFVGHMYNYAVFDQHMITKFSTQRLNPFTKKIHLGPVKGPDLWPVSYTHLTLPTIYSV